MGTGDGDGRARPAGGAAGAAPRALTGLEFLQEILAGTIAPAPIAGPMNVRLTLAEPGRAAFRGTAGAHHLNPMGGVHGGWYGTLLDSALGCAVMTMMPRGRRYTTLEYKVNLVRALPLGLEVECAAAVSHCGRRTATAEGSIRGLADGRLYATGSTTCLILED